MNQSESNTFRRSTAGVYISMTGFFLKNLYFSASTNPVVFVVGVAMGVLWLSLDLHGHDILFAMCICAAGSTTVASSLVTGDRKSPIDFFALLPISRSRLLSRIVIAGCVYAVIVAALLCSALKWRTGIPLVGGVHVTHSTLETGEVQRVVEGFYETLDDRRRLPYYEPKRPSLILGIFNDNGYDIFPFWQVLIPLFFGGLTTCMIGGRIARFHMRHTGVRIVQYMGMLILIATSIILIADYSMPSFTIWRLRTWIDSHAWVLPVIVGILAAGLWMGVGCVVNAISVRNPKDKRNNQVQ